jgi:hypothetical protein
MNFCHKIFLDDRNIRFSLLWHVTRRFSVAHTCEFISIWNAYSSKVSIPLFFQLILSVVAKYNLGLLQSGFQVLIGVTEKNNVFWDMTLCSQIKAYHCPEKRIFLLQDYTLSHPRSQLCLLKHSLYSEFETACLIQLLIPFQSDLLEHNWISHISFCFSVRDCSHLPNSQARIKFFCRISGTV